MSTPLSDTGREALRAYVAGPSGFRYLAVLDASGTVATTIDIVEDSRGSWGPPADNPVTAAVAVQGTDSDIAAPLEVSGSALLLDPSDDLADAVHEQTFAGPNLVVDGSGTEVIEHTVEIPPL
jgi:hypothetical protein